VFLALQLFVTLGDLPIALLERCVLLAKALQHLLRKRGHLLRTQALELVFGDLAHLRHVGSSCRR
jgi:hypothetical protein